VGSAEWGQSIGDELGAQDEEQDRHDCVVVHGEPVLELRQSVPRAGATEQVVEDRRADRDAADDDEDDQRADGVPGRESERGEPGTRGRP
jgi:hypothetical protein